MAKFVQGLVDRLLARAARLSSEAQDPNRPRLVRRGSLQDSESAAADRAREAWARGDVTRAVEEIELFADYSSKPDTVLLHGELLMVAGNVDRAKQVLERGLRGTPGHPGLLEALAELHGHLGNATEEFRLRRRRLKAGSRYGARDVISAMRAMMHAWIKEPMVKGDFALISRLFDQVEPLASPAERLEFAELLFTIKRTRDRAIELALANAPAVAGSTLTTYQYVTLDDIPTRHEKPDTELEATSLRMAEIRDAGVLPGVSWSPTIPATQEVLQGFVNSPWVTARMQPDSQLVMQNTRELLVRVPQGEPRRIEQPVVLVGDHPDFYRFVVDHLSRLATLETLGLQPRDALWAIGDQTPACQLQYLTLLGVPAGRLLRVGASDPIVFRHALAPFPLARGGRSLSPLLPDWLRNKLAQSLSLPAQKATRRIFLSSARADSRRVTNESELLPWLESRGFECVEIEDLDAEQQVRLFAQARELVVAAGGALAYMVFMPAGGRVTALYNTHLPASVESLDYDYLARACGHGFFTAGGVPAERSDDPGADFSVPLDALQKALEAA